MLLGNLHNWNWEAATWEIVTWEVTLGKIFKSFIIISINKNVSLIRTLTYFCKELGT